MPGHSIHNGLKGFTQVKHPPTYTLSVSPHSPHTQTNNIELFFFSWADCIHPRFAFHSPSAPTHRGFETWPMPQRALQKHLHTSHKHTSWERSVEAIRWIKWKMIFWAPQGQEPRVYTLKKEKEYRHSRCKSVSSYTSLAQNVLVSLREATVNKIDHYKIHEVQKS